MCSTPAPGTALTEGRSGARIAVLTRGLEGRSMLIIKLTELDNGTIVAETPRQIIGRFPRSTRADVIAYLQHKARECDEELRIVESFDELDSDGPVNFRKLMRRDFP